MVTDDTKVKAVKLYDMPSTLEVLDDVSDISKFLSDNKQNMRYIRSYMKDRGIFAVSFAQFGIPVKGGIVTTDTGKEMVFDLDIQPFENKGKRKQVSRFPMIDNKAAFVSRMYKKVRCIWKDKAGHTNSRIFRFQKGSNYNLATQFQYIHNMCDKSLAEEYLKTCKIYKHGRLQDVGKLLQSE